MENTERDAAPDGEAQRPFVSIIVPVYNDPAGLTTTLDSLTEQWYPADRHEIIVVDNGSTDRTAHVAAEYGDVSDRVRVLSEPAGGSYAARNAGIDAATGSVLAFVDADMSVAPDWLSSVVDRLRRTGAAYLGCDVEVASSSDRESIAARYDRQTAFPIRDYVEQWEFAPTCCLIVRREVVADVGRFDARMLSGGDREFGNRVADAGYRLAFAEDVSMTHPPRATLRSLFSKSIRVGRGVYQLRRYYPERYGHPFALLVNPMGYTPPPPNRLADRVRGWDELAVHEKLLFFVVAWLLNLGNTYGKYREMIGDGGGYAALRVSADASD